MKKLPKIICSEFLLKNDDITKSKLYLDLVYKNWNKRRQGYRKDVFLVPLPVKYFKSNIVKLKNGDYLFGQFEKRVPSELPRKKVVALADTSKLLPLKSVDAVIYSKEALLEGNENTDLSADYEIITIIKKVVKGEQPMPPETMIYNFFKLNGGTDMKISNKKFLDSLKTSFVFWSDKAIIHKIKNF